VEILEDRVVYGVGDCMRGNERHGGFSVPAGRYVEREVVVRLRDAPGMSEVERVGYSVVKRFERPGPPVKFD